MLPRWCTPNGKALGCQRGVFGVCVALLVADLCQAKRVLFHNHAPVYREGLHNI